MASNTRARTSSRFVALGCVGFIASAPALAQDDAAADEPTQLEGMAVTYDPIEEDYGAYESDSPKFTAPLVDTPRIVNVITEEVLEDTASFSLEDAFRTVPGITLGAGEGGVASADIPLIRGVDATGDVFVDGVRDIGSQTREIFALERIEVSKGPSTAFGGRGAAAGAINLVSKVAREGDFATGQVTVGTDDLIRVVGDVNREVSDMVAVRLVGMYHDSMVPGRDEVFDDRWGIAPSITLGAGGPVTASLDFYHLEGDAMPDYGVPLTGSFGEPREPVDVDYDNFYGLLVRDFQETRIDAATFQIDAELADGIVLSNATRYTDSRNNYIVTNPNDSAAGNIDNGVVWRAVKSRNSQNEGIASNTNLSVDTATGSILHSISAGFEFSFSDTVNRNYSVDTGDRSCPPEAIAAYNCTSLDDPDPSDPWNGSITPSDSPSTASAEDYSFYLFDTVTLMPNLLLNGGIRWTNFSAEASGCGRGGCFDEETETDFWSYQGGVIFKPTELTSLYVSYANAKNPAGTTVGEGAENLGSDDRFFEPQETENWEAGAKAELFEGSLLASAAVFRVERGNIVPTDPESNLDPIIAEARIQGFELSVSGQAGPVRMLVGYTYVDSEIRDDDVLNDDDPTNDGEAVVGNYLPQTPEHNFAATVDWQVTPQFSIGGGAYGASERYADTSNLIRADGYVRFDAHAEFQFNDALGVRVNVNNVTDERYVTKLRNPHFAVPAEGRQALVTLTGRF